MRRGEIWWARLPAPVGSEPGHRRPMLVVSANSYNQSRISTVVCAAITSNVRLAAAPGNVLLKPSETGLGRESVVNVSQIVTIDKQFLSSRVGVLPLKAMQAVEKGLRLALSL